MTVESTLTRTAIAACVVLALLLITDAGPNVPIVLALTALVASIVWFLRDTPAAVAVREKATLRSAPLLSYPDLRTTTLRQGLASGARDTHLSRRIYANLVSLVDDQLTAVHGIDRHLDPDAALAVIGDELYLFVTHPDAANSMTPASLERIITMIEQI